MEFKNVDPNELNTKRPIPSGLKGDREAGGGVNPVAAPGGGNLYRGNTEGDVELVSTASKTSSAEVLCWQRLHLLVQVAPRTLIPTRTWPTRRYT